MNVAGHKTDYLPWNQNANLIFKKSDVKKYYGTNMQNTWK